jgi:hypothetical protein
MPMLETQFSLEYSRICDKAVRASQGFAPGAGEAADVEPLARAAERRPASQQAR